MRRFEREMGQGEEKGFPHNYNAAMKCQVVAVPSRSW